MSHCFDRYDPKDYPAPIISGETKTEFGVKIPEAVNHPPHYNQGGIECIDAIEAAVAGLKGIEAVDTAQVLKYMWRWKYKNGIQDLQKARWYLEHLMKHLEETKA